MKRLLIEIGAAVLAVAATAIIIAYYRGQVADLKDQLRAAEQDAADANTALDAAKRELISYSKAAKVVIESQATAVNAMEDRNNEIIKTYDNWGACLLPDSVRNAFNAENSYCKPAAGASGAVHPADDGITNE